MSATAMTTYAPADADLSQWLASRIKEGCNRVALRQRGEDGTAQRVREWPLSPEVNAAELADAIQKRAWEDGRHFGTRAVYGVFAYRDHLYVDRTFLTIEGDGDGEGLALAPGPTKVRDIATEQLGAVTGQLMRHNEANIRLAIGQTVDVIGHYKSLLDARDRRIEDLERRNDEVVGLYQKLTTMEHERGLDVMREERENRKVEFLREKLDLALPVLLSKLASHMKGPNAANGNAAGKGGTKAAPGEGATTGEGILKEELLSQLLGSLNEEQTKKILSVLSPEQQLAIQDLYVTYGKRDIEKKAAKAAKEEQSRAARKKTLTVVKEER